MIPDNLSVPVRVEIACSMEQAKPLQERMSEMIGRRSGCRCEVLERCRRSGIELLYDVFIDRDEIF